MTSNYYITDPGDPDAPVRLTEYNGLHDGASVAYENPAWRQPDGTYYTGGMDPPLVVTEILQVGPHVTAILNDGEWETNADNLRAVDS